MDPWLNENINIDSNNESINNFEDNFQPTISSVLPDSEQYLATLENKLYKLKSDPNVLKQLSDRHTACMEQLLETGAELNTEEILHLDTPVPDSILLRTILPQRQAVNIGELKELLNYDQLQTIENNLSSSSATTSIEDEDNTSR